jgi:aspartate kinase
LLEALGGIEALKKRHLDTLAELKLPREESARVRAEMETALGELETLARGVATLGELTPRSRDAMVAHGEGLSCRLLGACLSAGGTAARFVDSRTLLITDNQFGAAIPDLEETSRLAGSALKPLLAGGIVPVTQGFVGATREGLTTTLGRGGSDYSAAVLGAALGAEAIEIWTDVDGMLTADPRVVTGARRIREISFEEAAELSFFGAKVLHPSTVLPAVERGIPVLILNTFRPDGEGTRISSRPPRSASPVKSIAMKRGITVVHISSTRMLQAHGFLKALFEVFDRHRTAVDVVTTSEVSVSVTIEDTRNLEDLKRDLASIGTVKVEPGMAIICVVGEGLRGTPGAVAGIFAALGQETVHMVSQGASEINLTFVVPEASAAKVVQKLHEALFREADSAIFA